MQLSAKEQFDRLVYVAGWAPDATASLLKTCAEKELDTPEQILAYAQMVFDNECLSALRGGDPALDAMVTEALGNKPGNPQSHNKQGQSMHTGTIVFDATDSNLGRGRIIDVYENRYCGPEPVTMLTVDFGDDQIFDRLPEEVMTSPV